MHFDLVDEPWVPVVADGARRLVSLRDALVRADDYAALAVTSPCHGPAILRQVLLSVLLDALGPPRTEDEWGERFSRGRFSAAEREAINAYLDRHRARFDLLDVDAPFAQVGDLVTQKGETKPVGLLVAAFASGNNVPLFSTRTEGDPFALAPPDAAVWLLSAQCWDTAAIKTAAHGDPQAAGGKTTGNPTGPLGQLGVITPVGRSLFETLILNSPVMAAGRERLGTPHWRRDPMGPTWRVGHAEGLLDLLTWQSRRIRLFCDEVDGRALVTRVIVAAGDRLAETPQLEPHTAWRLEGKPKQGQPPQRPKRHTPGKAAWRGAEALLALAGAGGEDASEETSSLLAQAGSLRLNDCLAADYPLRVETCGVAYGNQSAVVDDVIADSIPLPIAALTAGAPARNAVLEAVGQIEKLGVALNRLSADLRRAQGGDPLPWDKSQRPGDVLLHGMDAWARRLFAGLQTAGDDGELIERGQIAWEQAARQVSDRIAAELLQTVPGDAFGGREIGGTTYREATAEMAYRGAVKKILYREAGQRSAAPAA